MRFLGVASLLLLSISGCATAGGRLAAPHASEVGLASYYSPQHQGRRTASGARYDSRDLTAAHRTLAFGSRARVTRLDSGRSVVVTINDRGPFVRGRVIDVSRRAAEELGFVRSGTTRVRVEPLN